MKKILLAKNIEICPSCGAGDRNKFNHIKSGIQMFPCPHCKEDLSFNMAWCVCPDCGTSSTVMNKSCGFCHKEVF
jgi:transposase-like protein